MGRKKIKGDFQGITVNLKKTDAPHADVGTRTLRKEFRFQYLL